MEACITADLGLEKPSQSLDINPAENLLQDLRFEQVDGEVWVRFLRMVKISLSKWAKLVETYPQKPCSCNDSDRNIQMHTSLYTFYNKKIGKSKSNQIIT